MMSGHQSGKAILTWKAFLKFADQQSRRRHSILPVHSTLGSSGGDAKRGETAFLPSNSPDCNRSGREVVRTDGLQSRPRWILCKRIPLLLHAERLDNGRGARQQVLN
jgi:hypothetical protein